MSQARGCFARAAREAEHLGDPALLGRAALGYAGPTETGASDEHVVELLERALSKTSDERLRALLLARLAAALHALGFLQRSEDAGREAVERARATRDPAIILTTMRGYRRVLSAPERMDEALKLSDDMVAAALQAGDLEQTAFAYGWRIATRFGTGPTEAVVADLARAAKLADRTHDEFHRATCRMWRSSVALMQGRLEEAERESRRAFSRTSLGVEDWIRTIQSTLIRREAGTLEHVDQIVDHILPDIEDPAWAAMGPWLLAEIGSRERASRGLNEIASDDFGAIPRDGYWLFAMGCAAQAAAQLGHERIGARIYSALLPFAGRACAASGIAWGGLVSRHLGMLARLAGDIDTAVQHLNRATRQAQDFGVLERGWSLYERAEALAEAATRADRKRGTQDAGEALDIARQFGLHALTSRLLLRQGRREPSGEVWSKLTRSEIAVARLVAEGLSNPEIARTLYLSRFTVETHLKEIFAKLGVRSRAELAARYARRQVGR